MHLEPVLVPDLVNGLCLKECVCVAIYQSQHLPVRVLSMTFTESVLQTDKWFIKATDIKHSEFPLINPLAVFHTKYLKASQ